MADGEQVAPAAQHAGYLRSVQATARLGDEIEMVVRVGETARGAGLEGDSALRVEPDPADRLADRFVGAVDAPNPGSGELTGQEEHAVAAPAADLEDPLGSVRQVEDRGGKRGELRGGHRRMIPTRGLSRLGSAPMGDRSDRTKLIALGVFAVLAAGIVAAILISRGGDDEGASTAASAAGCEEVEAPKPKNVNYEAPRQTVNKGAELTAVVETSCGSFEIALDARRAPKTVNSFVFLAEKGFYDGITFHRVAPGFVIQGGDPLGDGTGGPGYSVDEKPPPNLAYTKGVVAMAKSSAEPPGRSGSQFFVVLSADAGLEPEYALVGRVSEGFDVVKRIGELGTPAEEPKQTVLIDAVSIERG